MYALIIAVALAVSLASIGAIAKGLKARNQRLRESARLANISMSELQVQYSQ